VNLSALAACGRTPPAPCDITLAQERLHVEAWLRVLPGQRYVARTRWPGRGSDRAVLAKLLVGRKAERRYQAELTGARHLAAQGITTPALLAHGFSAGQGGWLLFDWLHDAQSLHQAWQQSAAPLAQAHLSLLADALAAIASLHRCGLWQADLHLDNLLRQHGVLFWIDGGSVCAETPGQPLSRQRAIDNLALFFAQLTPRIDPHIAALLAHYQHANPTHNLMLADLHAAIARRRQRRIRDYVKKSTRDCSLFAARVGIHGLQVVRRDEAASLQPLLAELDARLEAGHIFKTGGSASVARIDWQARALVVKRYNIKNRRHALRRCWRPSRAVHSWREAHRLDLLDIATPRPLAVIEERCFGLRQRAYLITDYCDGPDLLAYFAKYLDTPPPEAPVAALVQLLDSLMRARISHGDCKGHNLIWRDGRWWLIDLDAMQQHRCPRRYARAYARDRARLLRNFPADCALHRLLDARLPRFRS